MKTLFFSFFSISLFLSANQLKAQCTADAGPDVWLCTDERQVTLNGTGFTSSGQATFQWSGGAGSFFPSVSHPKPTYVLSAAEMTAGVAGLVLRVTDPVTSCVSLDTMFIIWGMSCNSGFVAGKVFDDLNANGVQDAGENGIPNKYVYSSQSATTTDGNGNYMLRVLNGNSEIATQITPYRHYTTPASPFTHTVTVASDTTTGKNFGMAYIPDIKELSIYLFVPWARPGFTADGYISCRNNGTDTLNGTIEFKYDPNIVFIGATPAASSHNASTQTLTYTFSNFKPGDVQHLQVEFQVPVATPLGTQLQFTGIIDPVAGDVNTLNNYDTLVVEVVGSCDPNDKNVEPKGVDPQGYITSSQELEYLIRFQNTGTADAITVVIRDTIDTDLDLLSFEMLDASHNYQVSYETGRVLVWTFNNIMLPDSNTNEPESHGYVRYRINQKDNNPDGTEITNGAAIYFDYNYPVITGKTLNTVNDNLLLSMQQKKMREKSLIRIYPNPSNSHIHVEVQFDASSYSIISTSGVVVKQGAFEETIRIDELKEGTYFIKLQSAEMTSYERIVVK